MFRAWTTVPLMCECKYLIDIKIHVAPDLQILNYVRHIGSLLAEGTRLKRISFIFKVLY